MGLLCHFDLGIGCWGAEVVGPFLGRSGPFGVWDRERSKLLIDSCHFLVGDLCLRS